MAELEKRVSGDWIEIREKSNDLYAVLETLDLPAADLHAAADRLRLSVENGIVEFKRGMLSPVLVSLETARYRAIDSSEMAAQERALTQLLLAVLVQRLLCASILAPARKEGEKRVFGVEGLQLTSILADINARVSTDPALKAHAAVKTIRAQVQRYNAENQKMRELLPTIKPELRTSFLANFTRTFEEIVASIRRQYAGLLQEESDAQQARPGAFSLAQFPLKELVPLLASQAKEVARFRSTLAHAREEKFRTRESLVRLYDGRQSVLKLIEDEPKAYRRVCQMAGQGGIDSCASALATAFRDEVVAVLDRQGRREEKE